MIEYREKFYVSSDELKNRVPVEHKPFTTHAVAGILVIALMLLLLMLLKRSMF